VDCQARESNQKAIEASAFADWRNGLTGQVEARQERIQLTAADTCKEFWRLVMGSSPLGEVLRAMTFYLIVLLGAYFVGLVHTTAGAILTLVLVLVSVSDLLKTSEESFFNLLKTANIVRAMGA
jgi:hypothetical protein